RRKRPRNVIVHTDRGGQYCSADYQAQLKRHNLRGSMSAKGCCYDNACVESFFHSLKVECIHGEHFISREIMRATVFNYIECDYNRWRGQDHLTRFCFQIMWLVRRTNHKVHPLIFIDQKTGNDSNLLIVFYVQIMPDDFVMQLHRF
ncbi:IS3 family transposase, partial [Escherichia coli]